MKQRISVAELHQRFAERLGFSWVCGEALADARQIESPAPGERPCLVGFLNLIHPNRIQVIGDEEVRWLDALDARQRWETLARIVDSRPAAILVAGGQEIAQDLEQAARESATPLLLTRLSGWELVSFLEYQLARELATAVTVHGVFMEIFTIGVLITGEAGTGKSELALELMSRGHRLIADDAPEFTQLAPDIVEGSCPPVLKDFLEVRGLGLLNVRRMFGDAVIKSSKYLRLIIHLHPPGGESKGDRLRGNFSTRRVCDIEVPQINLPVLAGRNLAVMAEVAVRDFMLRLKGFNAATEFMERHRRLMQEAV
ncbi:MAG: HPr(Ser) kinase/phosphatase [Wenzhouxiangella sp.]